MSWQVDWSKRMTRKRSGNPWVWARNLESKMPASREWHWTPRVTLDKAGIPWVYHSHGIWGIDWTKRRRLKKALCVWARNLGSSQERAREWHWTAYRTLQIRGVKWKKILHPARRVTPKGYVIVCKSIFRYRALKGEDCRCTDSGVVVGGAPRVGV